MKEKKVIQGYTIIQRIQAGEVMISLGHNPNPKEPAPFVTWKSYEHDGFSSFHYGNYFPTRQSAMIDFYKRLSEAWENYTPAKKKAKKPQRSDPPAR